MTRASRPAGTRKRDIKVQAGLWVVWVRPGAIRWPLALGRLAHRRRVASSGLSWQAVYVLVEKVADRTVSYIVPFYGEIKMAVLLWMLLSRAVVRIRCVPDSYVPRC